MFPTPNITFFYYSYPNSSDSKTFPAIGRTIRVKDTDNASQETDQDVPMSAGLLARPSLSSPRTSNSAGSSELKSKQTMEMRRCFRGTSPSKEQKDDAEKSGSQGCGDSNRKRSHSDADSKQSTPDQTDELNFRKYVANGGSVLNSKRAHTLEATIFDLEEYINKVKWLKKLLHYGFHPPENQGHHWKFVEPNDVSEIPK